MGHVSILFIRFSSEQRRYYLFQRVWHQPFQSPIEQPKFIIHWACGAGPWEHRVVQEYPECKVIDIDYKPPMVLNTTPNPRIEYRQLSITDRTKDHGLADYQDNTVDLIVLRNIWLLGADTSQWREILRHAFRILRPGGWIELYDQGGFNRKWKFYQALNSIVCIYRSTCCRIIRQFG